MGRWSGRCHGGRWDDEAGSGGADGGTVKWTRTSVFVDSVCGCCGSASTGEDFRAVRAGLALSGRRRGPRAYGDSRGFRGGDTRRQTGFEEVFLLVPQIGGGLVRRSRRRRFRRLCADFAAHDTAGEHGGRTARSAGAEICAPAAGAPRGAACKVGLDKDACRAQAGAERSW